MYSGWAPWCFWRFAIFFFMFLKASLKDFTMSFLDLFSMLTSFSLLRYSDFVGFLFDLWSAESWHGGASSRCKSLEASLVIIKPADVLKTPPPCSACSCTFNAEGVAVVNSQLLHFWWWFWILWRLNTMLSSATKWHSSHSFFLCFFALCVSISLPSLQM